MATAIFVCEHPSWEGRVRSVLHRLPPVDGAPVLIVASRGLRDRYGAVHAGAFLRKRRIAFDCTRSEFPRVFCHEIFHFVWVRAGNDVRLEFEDLLKAEWRSGARGELWWSAEWRKRDLSAGDVLDRSRRWREYCCESFCDTAAWLYCGVETHEEYTLERRLWFEQNVGLSGLSI